MVIYQASPADSTAVLSLEDLYGICADDPIDIDNAGTLDTTDEDLTRAFE